MRYLYAGAAPEQGAEARSDATVSPAVHQSPNRRMIEVQSITLRELELPLLRPFRSAGGEVRVRRVLLLAIDSMDDTSSWSECVAQSEPSYSPETVDSAWLATGEWLAPRLVGRGVTIGSPADAYCLLAAGIRGHRMAIAAVEMGIWNLFAHQEGIPLAALLARFASGRAAASASASEPVRGHDDGWGATPPAQWVAAGTTVGMGGTADDAARRTREACERGYRRIRLKVAPDDDVERVRAVVEAAGDRVPVVADANGSYDPGDPLQLAALERLDGLGLAMLEQPLAPHGLAAHAALRRWMATPVALDESITGYGDAREAMQLGAMDALNLKPGRVGGLGQSVAIHDECLRRGIPAWCGGMLETGIGRAYNVALASLPGFTIPGDLGPGDAYWARDVVSPAWTMDPAGRVRVPLDRPGLGVEVDESFVEALTVRARVIR